MERCLYFNEKLMQMKNCRNFERYRTVSDTLYACLPATSITLGKRCTEAERSEARAELLAGRPKHPSFSRCRKCWNTLFTRFSTTICPWAWSCWATRWLQRNDGWEVSVRRRESSETTTTTHARRAGGRRQLYGGQTVWPSKCAKRHHCSSVAAMAKVEVQIRSCFCCGLSLATVFVALYTLVSLAFAFPTLNLRRIVLLHFLFTSFSEHMQGVHVRSGEHYGYLPIWKEIPRNEATLSQL